jgi:hypothetical protein
MPEHAALLGMTRTFPGKASTTVLSIAKQIDPLRLAETASASLGGSERPPGVVGGLRGLSAEPEESPEVPENQRLRPEKHTSWRSILFH